MSEAEGHTGCLYNNKSCFMDYIISMAPLSVPNLGLLLPLFIYLIIIIFQVILPFWDLENVHSFTKNDFFIYI